MLNIIFLNLFSYQSFLHANNNTLDVLFLTMSLEFDFYNLILLSVVLFLIFLLDFDLRFQLHILKILHGILL